MASRYGAMPSVVLNMDPGEFVAALNGAREEERDAYRRQAFPVWLQGGKKAGSWPQFLRKLNLSAPGEKPQKKRRSTVDVQSIYERAEAIKTRHLARSR